MSIKKRIAVFVSGGGTNLQALIERGKQGNFNGEICLVVSDKKDCYALKRAENNNIATYILDTKSETVDSDLLDRLEADKIDLIVLAGYLKILPKSLIDAFNRKIINLHPSILPKFGGKSMYGDRVHQAVLESGENLSGATVHYVDTGVDTGEIIKQEFTNVYKSDDISSLAGRIHRIEHSLLPKVVADLVRED